MPAAARQGDPLLINTIQPINIEEGYYKLRLNYFALAVAT